MISYFLLTLPALIWSSFLLLLSPFSFTNDIFTSLQKFTDVLWAFDFMIPVATVISVFSAITLLWSALLVYKVLLFIYSVIRGGIHFRV